MIIKVLGKNYPVRIAALGNAGTRQSFFRYIRIFPRSCMDLPEDGEGELGGPPRYVT